MHFVFSHWHDRNGHIHAMIPPLLPFAAPGAENVVSAKESASRAIIATIAAIVVVVASSSIERKDKDKDKDKDNDTGGRRRTDNTSERAGHMTPIDLRSAALANFLYRRRVVPDDARDSSTVVGHFLTW